MKKFNGFVRKEFYHILRDKRTLLILFGLPIMLVIIFGYALNNDLKNVPIAILDQSKDSNSIKLTNKLLSSGYFVLVANLKSEKDIENAFKEGKIKMILTFPPNFSNELFHNKKANVQLIADATEINTATSITGYASAIINDYNVQTFGENTSPIGLNISNRMIFNQRLLSVYVFIPGVIGLVILIISALLTSITLTREKETGTMELLSISPLNPFTIIIGKVVPYLLLTILNCFIIILMGIYIFHLPMNGSVILLALECVLYITTCLSVGILISTNVDTQQAAMFTSLVSLMMPSMLLSGFIFPLESLPIALQYMSQIIPTTHFINAIKLIMIKGSGLEIVWKQTLISLAMIVVFLGISIIKIKKKYQ